MKKSIVDHTYRDYSQVKITDLVDDYKAVKVAKEEMFPAKLHKILSMPEYENIIKWQPHGRAWAVVDKSLFASDVLPKYFDHKNFHSFNRSVNGWGFKRLTRAGPDQDAYYHEMFLRGLPELTCAMSRLINPGKRLPNKADEPDFYDIGRKWPLPDSLHSFPRPPGATEVGGNGGVEQAPFPNFTLSPNKRFKSCHTPKGTYNQYGCALPTPYHPLPTYSKPPPYSTHHQSYPWPLPPPYSQPRLNYNPQPYRTHQPSSGHIYYPQLNVPPASGLIYYPQSNAPPPPTGPPNPPFHYHHPWGFPPSMPPQEWQRWGPPLSMPPHQWQPSSPHHYHYYPTAQVCANSHKDRYAEGKLPIQNTNQSHNCTANLHQPIRKHEVYDKDDERKPAAHEKFTTNRYDQSSNEVIDHTLDDPPSQLSKEFEPHPATMKKWQYNEEELSNNEDVLGSISETAKAITHNAHVDPEADNKECSVIEKEHNPLDIDNFPDPKVITDNGRGWIAYPSRGNRVDDGWPEPK